MRSGRPGTAALKRVLLSLIVVGLIGSITYKRVSAVVLSETANTGGSLTSATFTLDTTIGANGVCHSYGSASPNNNQNVCSGTTGLLFSATPLRYPGDQSWVSVAVKNSGSVDSQDLQVAMDSCHSSTTTGAVLRGNEGTANACGSGGLELSIQETDSGGTNLTNGCLYPDAHSSYNSFSPPDAPGTGSVTDCNTSWTADTLDTLANVISCWDLGRLAAGQTRYFKVGVQFPWTSDNSFQGTTATFDLTWHIDSIDATYTPNLCANDF